MLRLEFGPNSIRGEAICGPSGKPNDIACNPGEVFDSFTIGHDGPPIITGLPPSVIDSVGRTLSLEVRASDPDGDPIDSLTADLTGLPSGNDAVFSPRPGNASGRLTWTPSIRDTGTYRIEFRAVNALAATASIVVGVRAAPIASSVAAASLAVEDVHPNPAASGLTLAYSSAGGEAPRLELLDVAGRAVVRLDLGRQAPGHHVAELKRPANLPPGLYWLRLAQSGHAVFARIVFMP